MKKILIILTAVLLFSVCLFSCGDKDRENGSENEIAVENNTNTAEDSEETAETEKTEETDTAGDAEPETIVEADDSLENTAENSEIETDSDNKQSEENTGASSAESVDAVSCTAVWVSSEAFLDGERLDPETDGKMEMQLALFDDGEYIMAAYLDGELLENYPQQDTYELSGNTLKLASGWQGEINGETMDMSYNDGTSEVSFRCTLAASAE